MGEPWAQQAGGALRSMMIAALSLMPCYTAGAACAPRILQASMAKDVAGELHSSAYKFGCHYSGVDCTASGDRLSCQLLKTEPTRSDSPRCIPSVLARSIESDLSGELRDAKRKFGCGPVSSVRCGKDDASRPEWVSCSVVFKGQQDNHEDTGAQHGAANDHTSDYGCDLAILTNTLSHELFEATQKANRRYDCPLLDSVSCVSNSLGWVDCSANIDDSAVVVPSSCNMMALTEKISAEFGEELADAEAKYECPIPPHLDCHRSLQAHGTYSCTIGQTSTEKKTRNEQSYTTKDATTDEDGGNTNDSSGGTSSAESSDKQGTKQKWKFRYFRGKRVL